MNIVSKNQNQLENEAKNKFSWKKHIGKVREKINKFIYVLKIYDERVTKKPH